MTITLNGTTGIDQSNVTGASTIPSGTTAERPASPVNGMIRYNTTIGRNEIYQNGIWNNFSFAYDVEYLVVAGGGAGGGKTGTGNNGTGGGGAGGVLETTASVETGVPYTVTVGSGGAGNTVTGNNGTNSAFYASTAIGGGGGGSEASIGQSGGSGGGTGTVSGGATSPAGSGTCWKRWVW
jgi:hypothetical protein